MKTFNRHGVASGREPREVKQWLRHRTYNLFVVVTVIPFFLLAVAANLFEHVDEFVGGFAGGRTRKSTFPVRGNQVNGDRGVGEVPGTRHR
jgi:hypothetical protein